MEAQTLGFLPKRDWIVCSSASKETAWERLARMPRATMLRLAMFPALTAMRIFRSFLSVTVCAAIVSVFCALLGMLVSITMGTPVGSTIVAVDAIVYALTVCVTAVAGGRR